MSNDENTGVWAGLGQRPGTGSPSPQADDDTGEFDRAPIQRTVDAATAPRVEIPASAHPLATWFGAGSAAAPAPNSEQPAPTNPEEEETMATKSRAAGAKHARKGKQGNPQREICSAFAEHGAMSREAIAQALPHFTSSQISSALNNAKANKRVTYAADAQAYDITAAGRKWLGVGSEPAQETTTRGGRRKGSTHRRGRVAREKEPPAEVDTSPAVSFRCGVMSDGAFFLSKGESSIELDADEHKQMLRYLERMAEEA